MYATAPGKEHAAPLLRDHLQCRRVDHFRFLVRRVHHVAGQRRRVRHRAPPAWRCSPPREIAAMVITSVHFASFRDRARQCRPSWRRPERRSPPSPCERSSYVGGLVLRVARLVDSKSTGHFRRCEADAAEPQRDRRNHQTRLSWTAPIAVKICRLRPNPTPPGCVRVCLRRRPRGLTSPYDQSRQLQASCAFELLHHM